MAKWLASRGLAACLLDFDVSLGDVRPWLGFDESAPDISQWAGDEASFCEGLQQISPLLWAMFAPFAPIEDPELIMTSVRALWLAEERFDVVIVDGSVVNRGLMREVLRCAGQVVAVAVPWSSSSKLERHFNMLRRLIHPHGNLSFVLNQFEGEDAAADAVDGLDIPFVARLPHQPSGPWPYVLARDPGDPLGKALAGLGEHLEVRLLSASPKPGRFSSLFA